jgi:hypothetical protein
MEELRATSLVCIASDVGDAPGAVGTHSDAELISGFEPLSGVAPLPPDRNPQRYGVVGKTASTPSAVHDVEVPLARPLERVRNFAQP